MINLDDCMLWAGPLNGSGYGAIRIAGLRTTAHRVMYMLFKGEIAAGLEVDHICDISVCINPDHLQLLTHAENMRKKYLPNCCNRGHELTDDNIYVLRIKNGKDRRSCKTCNLLNSKARWEKRKLMTTVKGETK